MISTRLGKKILRNSILPAPFSWTYRSPDKFDDGQRRHYEYFSSSNVSPPCCVTYPNVYIKEMSDLHAPFAIYYALGPYNVQEPWSLYVISKVKYVINFKSCGKKQKVGEICSSIDFLFDCDDL